MEVTVLGGGVSGVTTGLLLAVLGHRPTILTRRRADLAQGEHHPSFASLYPAASVIPHAIRVDDVVQHMEDTQALFEVVRQHGTCGVRQQMHYELFESPTPTPDYAPAMHGFRRLPDDGSGEPGAPRRPGAEGLFGWFFRTYFVETPTYLRRLYALFEQAGGRVEERRLQRENLPDLPGDALVNCLGAGAIDLFDDPRPVAYLRGCLVHADVPDLAVHPDAREVCSYNYDPAPSVYARADGSPGGLYVYPRTDTWVIGGSKRAGTLDASGSWQGPPIAGPTCSIDGLDVPRPVVTVNAEILEALYGVDIRKQSLRSTYGIRFARDLDGDGVRLAAHPDGPGGRPVVHNYGHGGAGVTLSWSCALRVARLLPDAPGPPTDMSSASPADATLLAHLARRARRLGVE